LVLSVVLCRGVGGIVGWWLVVGGVWRVVVVLVVLVVLEMDLSWETYLRVVGCGFQVETETEKD
jgi:hypothetical protein